MAAAASLLPLNPMSSAGPLWQIAPVAAAESNPLPAEPAYVPYNEEHPVLAYYYAWWEPEVLVTGIHRPALFPQAPARQIADDPALMREHIRQAQVAGIDGFIANQTSDMVTLLEMGQAYDFRATIQVDADGSAEDQLREFYHYANHPAMVRYQGRPVVFFWRAYAYDNAFWSDLRNRLDPDRHAVWLADGDRFDFIRGDAWDGISPYQIAWSHSPETQLPGWGAKAQASAPGKLYVPPVAPGCNDTPARPATCIQDRADGTYYQRTLQGALASNPPWAVVVSTWNEWLEDTQIEPSVEYGNLYLHLTREFADAFKGGSSAPACC